MNIKKIIKSLALCAFVASSISAMEKDPSLYDASFAYMPPLISLKDVAHSVVKNAAKSAYRAVCHPAAGWCVASAATGAFLSNVWANKKNDQKYDQILSTLNTLKKDVSNQIAGQEVQNKMQNDHNGQVVQFIKSQDAVNKYVAIKLEDLQKMSLLIERVRTSVNAGFAGVRAGMAHGRNDLFKHLNPMKNELLRARGAVEALMFEKQILSAGSAGFEDFENQECFTCKNRERDAKLQQTFAQTDAQFMKIKKGTDTLLDSYDSHVQLNRAQSMSTLLHNNKYLTN